MAPSVAEAMDAGFLPALDEDQSQDNMLTPSRSELPCTDTFAFPDGGSYAPIFAQSLTEMGNFKWAACTET